MSTTVAERISKLKRLIDRPGTLGEGQAAKAALKRVVTRLPIIGRDFEHFRSCRCGSTQFTIEPGKGPHAFHLRCAACSRGGMWMTRAEAKQLEDEHAEALGRSRT
jgi:hypothetical protein